MATKEPKTGQDPAQVKLVGSQALRLAALTGVPAKQLEGLTVATIAEKFRFQIDPQLLFFRKICGKVVKTDPATGIEYPVPFATVQVEDTDCSLLGFFPFGSRWSWYFPFRCHREVIASTRTDACGNFCVWVPRWDIDWVLRWRAERICYPIVFERPNLGDLVKELIPIPFPIDPGDPAPFTDIDRARISASLGPVAARKLDSLRSGGFGASRGAFDQAQGDTAFNFSLAPPLPPELGHARHSAACGGNEALTALDAGRNNLAERIQVDAKELRGLDLRRYIGPFQRCHTVFVPQWVPIIDIPDITFRVTQDIDGDGDEEQIYGEGYFEVRWDAGNIGPVKLEAGPQARAGLLCGPSTVPCTGQPAIVLAGFLPLVRSTPAAATDAYDQGSGYARLANRPHPNSGFHDAASAPGAAPFTGVLTLYGCNKTNPGATQYRLLYEYSADHGATFSSPTPFLGLTWPLYRIDRLGHLQTHFPAADASGWYPIALPPDASPNPGSLPDNPFMPEDVLIEWPTGNFANGRYRLTLELGAGGVAIAPTSAQVNFNVDNNAPTGALTVEWGLSAAGPFQPLGGICPVVRRGVTPVDTYFRVMLHAASPHLKAARLAANSCGGGDFVFISGSGGVQSLAGPTVPAQPLDPANVVYEHWHTAAGDHDDVLQVIYRLPGGTLEGTYGFSSYVSTRAFNPSGGDGGQLATPPWQYDTDYIAIYPSAQFSVINANP